MKNTLIKLIDNDSSYNKSATRYLYKTHPKMWDEIVQLTSFLSDDAKPKQRVWHIINDIYYTPVCAITGEPIKWHENRYFTAANASARTTLLNLSGKLNNQTEAANSKRKASNIEAVHRGRKYRSLDTYSDEQTEKRKQTVMARYGVDNPSKHPLIRKKISDMRIKNGATPINLRESRDIYYASVKRLTAENWNMYFDKINPEKLDRSKFNLDHIYSIQEGYRNSIPPYIISHWTNLRMLVPSQNSSKGMRCDKTIDALFNDVFKNQ